MQARNNQNNYGWVAIMLHWLMAPAIIGLFVLGWWMRQLSYYDPWYQQAPSIHKGIGILLLIALVLRLLWRSVNITPRAAPGTPRWQALTASGIHNLIYLLLLAIMLSGYLISTADGRPIDVFGWFSVAATIQGIPNQEDIAGSLHEILAWTLIILVSLHALAALKHHFFDKDVTLRRMLGLSGMPTRPNKQNTVTTTKKEISL
ncbi:cytochrome b [Microbulbifer variabilis]|uniref:Cytochrome b n=1 Tax=Microbulbifer variabilis TaxID=266805 RepID=A0ABY4V9G3_9GAMM|nr:cytochrome b [Microbulbifer variabilis]USD20920.1 cytochrome b [Microbulbifer variabilis]